MRDNAGFRFPASVETLATRLKALGYRTGAFVSAFPLASRFGLARGFDVYDDRFLTGEAGPGHADEERPGAATVEAARRWLAAGAGPSFLWIHLYDPHFPYAPPEPFASRFPDDPYARRGRGDGRGSRARCWQAPPRRGQVRAGRSSSSPPTTESRWGARGEDARDLRLRRAAPRAAHPLLSAPARPAARRESRYATWTSCPRCSTRSPPRFRPELPGRSLLRASSDREGPPSYFEALSGMVQPSLGAAPWSRPGVAEVHRAAVAGNLRRCSGRQ